MGEDIYYPSFSWKFTLPDATTFSDYETFSSQNCSSEGKSVYIVYHIANAVFVPQFQYFYSCLSFFNKEESEAVYSSVPAKRPRTAGM